jgi:hypothetical protein
MNHTISDLLLPVIKKVNKEPLETRLATRLFLINLQDEIARKVNDAVKGKKPSRAARRFQEIALRGGLNKARTFFESEANRNRPTTSALSNDVLCWMAKDGPVPQCINDAWTNTEGHYRQASISLPIDQSLLPLKDVQQAATREFLTQALGRLVE